MCTRWMYFLFRISTTVLWTAATLISGISWILYLHKSKSSTSPMVTHNTRLHEFVYAGRYPSCLWLCLFPRKPGPHQGERCSPDAGAPDPKPHNELHQGGPTLSPVIPFTVSFFFLVTKGDPRWHQTHVVKEQGASCSSMPAIRQWAWSLTPWLMLSSTPSPVCLFDGTVL